MFHTIRTPRPRSTARLLLASALAAACGSDADAPAAPGPHGSIALALSAPTLSVAAGSTGTVTATLTRAGGFSGPVTLAVGGAPNGIAATPEPIAAGATIGMITLAVPANAAAGTSQLTVRASGQGITDATASLGLSITREGNVSIKFCGRQGFVPLWVAFQDGTGPWVRTPPVPDADETFLFNVTQGRGGLAYVNQKSDGSYALSVVYGTPADLMSHGSITCSLPSWRTVNGLVAGLGPTGRGYVTIGGNSATVAAATPSFALVDVPSGVRDLVASRVSSGAAGSALDRLIVRRGINPPGGTSVGVLDLDSAESFAPVTRMLTIAGLGGDEASVTTSYYTSRNPEGLLMQAPTSTVSPRAYQGVPAGRQAPGDMHALTIVAAAPGAGATAASSRWAKSFFIDATDKVLTLGPALAPPVVSVAATSPYPRLRAQLARQSEYDKAVVFAFTQGSGFTTRTVSVTATAAYFAGSPIELTVPDLSTAGSWMPAWAPRASVPTLWSVTATGWLAAAGGSQVPAVDSTTARSATRIGTITP